MANHPKTPIILHKNDIVLVKPAKPTPSHTLSFSTIDNAPYFELICETIYVYRSNNSSNPTIKNPTLVLKEALSQVLVYYYPLAGKLNRLNNGKLQITCNGDGVPFQEAKVDCKLHSLNYLNGIDVQTAKLFVLENCTSGYYHPLLIQVTKFSCGGFTIGIGLSHSVCDGSGASQFYRALTELAGGRVEPSVNPVWERERLVGIASQEPVTLPGDKASLAASPYFPSDNVQHESFDVDFDSVKRLKTSLLKELSESEDVGESFTFTTVEALGAYVWRSKFIALKQNQNGKTVLTLTMGIRKLMNPPLPSGFYGNAFVASYLVLTGKELVEGPLYKVAKKIKQSKKMDANVDHIKKSLDFLETIQQQKVSIEYTGESMILTDWRQLGLMEEVDFGWERCVNMIPIPWNMHGGVDLVIFCSPFRLDSSMEGGVRVLVNLPGGAMSRFKEEMEALKKIGGENGGI